MWFAALSALVLATAPSARPQQALSAELLRQSEEVEHGTGEWFRLGFERIEAELRCDVRAAHASALHLLAEARESADPALVATAAAFANLTLAALEGPAHAGEWSALAEALPAGTPDWLHARHALARSRNLCQRARPGDELAAALEGSTAARASGDLGLRALAALVVYHVTHDSAETFYEDLRAELAELAADPGLEGFRHRILLLEYDDSYAEHTDDERLASLAEIEGLAQAQGDLSTLGWLAAARADLALTAGDVEGALHLQEQAAQLFARLGDRRDEAFAYETACDMAMARDQLERARAYLVRAEGLILGRGFEEREAGLLQSRFGLAVADKDTEVLLKLSDQLEQVRARQEEELLAYVPLRDKLLSAERRRVEAERELAAGRAEMEASRAETRRLLLAGVVAVLVLLSVLALRSRQGLLRANQRLASEMKRAEREAEARRALEERMRQLERAESLGLVVSGVAHDFNNLMVGVLGNADLLLAKEPDPQRRQRLQSIAESGQRASRLCKQLQTSTGEHPEPKSPLDLGAVVEELVPVLRTAVGSALELAFTRTDVPAVEGDRTMLEQAVLNLVTNARDAHARSIVLSVSVLELESEQLAHGHFRGEVRPGSYVCVEVRDDGEGMSEELLARIFDPFFTTRFPGRGLGLAVVFGAVRRHAALIGIESRTGAGSTFRLCLPLASEPVRVVVPQKPSPAQAAVAPLDVLAIDDEPPVRAFVSAALEEHGHRVRTLADGLGLDVALRGFVDSERAVLLLDLTLPGQDGRDMARAALRERPGLPIVLMSGHASAQIAELARELGLDVWLQKPFTMAELETALARAVASRARAGELAQAGK
jgi:signal transduction histidine kinase/ActR/RegA family two-component response regulator